MNDRAFHFCFQQVGDANLCFLCLCFNRIPIAWMRLKASRLLEKRKMLFRFVLCLRNKRSICWWANDGDWTRAWWIHNPLPWSTWLHPPLPPHRFQSLSTIRSFWTPLWPLSKRSFFLYYINKSIDSCVSELGETKLQHMNMPGKASNKEVGLFTSLIWLHFT